jgi:hypothetical protein
MSTAIPAKPGFLQELSQALERDQFELWYQPTWYAQEKTIHGFEACCAGGTLSKALCCLVCLSLAGANRLNYSGGQLGH